MDFQNLLKSFGFLALFIFCMMMFVVFFFADNDPTNPILTDGTFNKTLSNLNSSLSSYQQDAEIQLNASETDNPLIDNDASLFFKIVGTIRAFSSTIKNVANIIATMVVEVLHINYIIIGVILGGLAITIILSAWRLYRQG